MVRQMLNLPHVIPCFNRNEEIQAIRQLPTKDNSEYLMKARYSQRVPVDYIGQFLMFALDHTRVCRSL